MPINLNIFSIAHAHGNGHEHGHANGHANGRVHAHGTLTHGHGTEHCFYSSN